MSKKKPKPKNPQEARARISHLLREHNNASMDIAAAHKDVRKYRLMQVEEPENVAYAGEIDALVDRIEALQKFMADSYNEILELKGSAEWLRT